VGFPTETEKDFLETLEVIKKCKFDIVNISRFGKRKGIEANNYKDLHGRIKKERSRIVTEICSKIALENNLKLVGKTKEVIITELGKNNQMIARTKEYKQVIFEKTDQKLGDILKLKIIDAKPGYLLGKRIS
jgi:tRNA A37 methylthiotransferase MiaB